MSGTGATAEQQARPLRNALQVAGISSNSQAWDEMEDWRKRRHLAAIEALNEAGYVIVPRADVLTPELKAVAGRSADRMERELNAFTRQYVANRGDACAWECDRYVEEQWEREAETIWHEENPAFAADLAAFKAVTP